MKHLVIYRHRGSLWSSLRMAASRWPGKTSRLLYLKFELIMTQFEIRISSQKVILIQSRTEFFEQLRFDHESLTSCWLQFQRRTWQGFTVQYAMRFSCQGRREVAWSDIWLVRRISLNRITSAKSYEKFYIINELVGVCHAN